MNPTLHTLGFSPTDRVVILHADDIGSSHGTVAAYAGLVEAGIMSSAAAMVPCPWFPAAAALCRQHRDDPRVDMGVHLTLNCEWSAYRWGPVSTRDPASGLLDDEGYFHRREPATQTGAGLDAVEQELRAQIDRALAAGIDVTHIDTHMLTLFHPRLLPIYLRLSRAYRLPAFLLRPDAAQLRGWGYGLDGAADVAEQVRAAEAAGQPLFDHAVVTPLERHANRQEDALALLAQAPPGLTYFLFHPAIDTPELRAFAPDWRARVADYQLFTSDAWRAALAAAGVQVIGWRVIRDALRNA
jgi:hypothetical protein